MEVHHSHHVAHKKKWKEDLLEFLMLFLAVFLGFFAENQREHVVERHRARDYAKSFYKDLRDDTTEIRAALETERFREACMDSIISISYSLKNQLNVPGKFYYYSRFVSNLYTLDWNSSTINQLVQSGSLRYFTNKELVAKINAYYATQQINNRSTQISHETRMKAADLRDQILQSRYYPSFSALDFMKEKEAHVPSPTIDSLMQLQLPLTAHAHSHIDQYVNLLSDWKSRLRLWLGNYPGLIKMATEIMQMLKEEYDLK